MNLKAVLRTYVILLVGRFASKALVFLSAAIAARALGPGQTGVYGTYLTGLAVAWIVMNTGMDAIAIRDIGRDRANLRIVVKELIRVRAAIGVALFLIALSIALLSQSELQLVLPLGVAALAYSLRCDWVLLAIGRDTAVSVAATLRELAYFGLVASVVALSPHVETALWCFASAEVVWSVSTVVMTKARAETGTRSVDGSRKALLAQGWPIGVMALMVLLYNKADMPLLVWMRGSREAGFYWAAYSLVFGVMGIAAELSRAAFAHMARASGHEGKTDSAQVMQLSILTSACGLAVALGLSGTANTLVRLAYGSEFEAGADALRILAWCVWANYSYVVLQQHALICGRQTQLAAVAGTAVAANIGLNLWLIPSIGTVGAAIASVVAEVTILVGAIWANWDKSGVRRVLAFYASAVTLAVALALLVQVVAPSSAILSTAIVLLILALVGWAVVPHYLEQIGADARRDARAHESRVQVSGACRVGVFQRVVPHYRVGVLDRLASTPGIELSVYATRFDKPLRYAKAVVVKEFRLGRIRVHPGVISRARTDHDVLLCEGGLSLLTSVLAVVGGGASRTPVIWWTSLWRRDGTVRIGGDLHGLITRHILSRCAAVVTYSQTAAKAAIDSGVPESRVFAAMNSLDTDTLLAAERKWADDPKRLQQFVDDLGMSGARVVLFIGRLVRGKGVETLLQAFADCVRSSKALDVRLLVVGDGSERYRLALKARALGISSRVTLLGAITEPAEVCPYFLISDVVVLPGAGGLALNQALTHGVPVIVGGGDGTERDIVRDGVNGYYVRQNDAVALRERMLEVLTAPSERRREMSGAARAAVVGRADGNAMLREIVAAIGAARTEQGATASMK